jgi:hypothetical protein
MLLQELRERREELVAAWAKAKEHELAEQRVKETVAYRLHERLQPLVYRLLREDSVLGRGMRRVTGAIYRALGR